MTRKARSRRELLTGLGGAAAVASLQPFVPLVEAAGPAPKRFAYWYFGVAPPSMTSYLPNTPGPLQFGSSLAPLNGSAVLRKMCVIRGLTHEDARRCPPSIGPHPSGGATVLMGQPLRAGVEPILCRDVVLDSVSAGFGPNAFSVDQYLATKLRGRTPFSDLRAGWRNIAGRFGNIDVSLSIANGNVVSRYQGPQQLFNDVFANVATQRGPSGDIQAMDLVRQRKSVLDFTNRRLSALRARLGSFDSAKLDAHAQSIRDLEGRLGSLPAASPTEGCRKPAAPAPTGTLKDAAEAYADLIAMAFACDLSRVAGAQFGTHRNDERHRFLPEGGPGWHNATHGGKTAYFDAVIGFRGATFLRLLEKLDAYRDVDGRTILDNTLAWLTFDLGYAHMAYDHLAILGGATGWLASGQMVKVSGTTNDLLTSVTHFMGFPVDKFGDATIGKGVLPSPAFKQGA